MGTQSGGSTANGISKEMLGGYQIASDNPVADANAAYVANNQPAQEWWSAAWNPAAANANTAYAPAATTMGDWQKDLPTFDPTDWYKKGGAKDIAPGTTTTIGKDKTTGGGGGVSGGGLGANPSMGNPLGLRVNGVDKADPAMNFLFAPYAQKNKLGAFAEGADPRLRKQLAKQIQSSQARAKNNRSGGHDRS